MSYIAQYNFDIKLNPYKITNSYSSKQPKEENYK